MKMSQLKWLFIVVLVIVNLFLVAQLAPRQISARAQRSQIKESLVSLVEKRGISLKKDAIPDDLSLERLEIQRSSRAQQEAAEAILGKCSVEDVGGGIVSYTSPTGSAIFRNGGDFVFELAGNNKYTGAKDAKKLFAALGISVSEDSITTLSEGGYDTVTVNQSIDGAELFDSRLSAVFGPGGLRRIEGQWVSQTSRDDLTDTGPCGAATALMAFLESVEREGIILSSVEGLTQGYITYRSGTVSALVPAWRIRTDTGVYIFDSSSGRISAAA